jgi:MFS family permease
MGRQRSLASLFLVSLFGLSFETFLSRYFAVALFSDYSYWVISLALLGYSFGGVVLTLARDHFHRHKDTYLLFIPPLLLAAAILAFALLRSNAFNPLQLQNEVLWKGQIANIFLYYAGLFPVFFLTGTYIGLVFLIHSDQMPKVYAVDLLGAACGAAVILGAMFLVHPYHLPAVMLPILFAVIALNAGASLKSLTVSGGIGAVAGSAALLGFGMYLVLSTSVLSVPDFKKLHSVLGIKEARMIGSRVSPGGSWLTMDDYTEYDDVSMTNNYGSDIASPPRTLGLYRDGQRVAALMREPPTDFSYLKGSLAFFPYEIRKHPRVLLIGTNGGMKIVESARSGAAAGVALEQPGDVFRLVSERLRGVDPGLQEATGIRLQSGGAFSLLRNGTERFDLIEVSSDFLQQDSNNAWSFTTEAFAMYLRSLSKGGILSIPVDISEFDVYALKVANTVAAALHETGITDPGKHVMAYRTAWTCQYLVSAEPFSGADVAHLVSWCSDRSFDTSWYPGIDPASISVWNDLPPVSFEQGEVHVSDNAQDALMNDLVRIFGTRELPPLDRFFNLTPSTMDRPDFSSISRLMRIRTLLARLQVLPEREIGYLLNLVVLAQALVLAIVVLLLPLGAERRAIRRDPQDRHVLPKVLFYFAALGFGFFFIELTLVKKLSFFLESSTLAFGTVLAGVLVFSGIGSWRSSRFQENRRRGLVGGLVVIAASLVFFVFGLDPLMRACIGLPLPVRILIAGILMAPLSLALGRPFALGTSSLGGYSDSLIPWAWAINGAFSVLATPLANILSVTGGWDIVLALALLLYLSTAMSFPGRKQPRSSR